MKFGQDYQAALSREEYPQDWVDSAISYKKLKKCIKKVQQELIGLGLDKDTLNELWQNVSAKSEELNGHLPGNGTTTTPATEDEHVLHYSLDGSEKARFAPKLTIAVDPLDGSPVDAWLSPDTRRVLRRLAKKDSVRRASLRASGLSVDDDESTHLRVPSPKGDRTDGSDVDSATDNDESRPHHFHTIEIPLTSDSEFFQILRRELAELDHLQSAEQERLHQAISALGNELRELKQSKKKRSKEEIEAWRNIFELYADAEVFSSSHESDAGTRDSAHAQKQFESFRKALQPRKSEVLKLGPTASRALERFLHINVNLLRLVKFQEINKTALTKIMKKFDKRTSLHTQATIRNSLTKAPFLAQDLARATCFTITNELISLIPQLNDYLCPICFSISWKPVRLKCNHVFCIRCLIVLQRQQKPHCPLCREEVVMEATNQNIDHELMAFLQANFKKVVKQKQHDNELAAGIDRWGEQYGNSQKCVVM